jgi:hypothetical protein
MFSAMINLAPFVGPRLKIERAFRHIRELSYAANQYVQTTTTNFGPYDPEAKGRRIQFSQPMPPMTGCIVGDAAHNLRSALDVLVCDVARLRGVPTSNVRFPLGVDEPGFEQRLKNCQIPRIGDDVATVIRSLRPYRSGNKALRDLHDLDVQDKHELVVPVHFKAFVLEDSMAYVAAGIEAALKSVHGYQDAPKDFKKQMKEGAPNLPFATVTKDDKLVFTPILGPPPHPILLKDGDLYKIEEDKDPLDYLRPLDGKMILRFPDSGFPFAGKPVLETLIDLAKAASEIVDLFATKFGGGDGEAHRAPSLDDPPIGGA